MKKIKTLLVDDDYLVLQDLKEMVDWNALGFSLIEGAANGCLLYTSDAADE